jgi:hypothetical protein
MPSVLAELKKAPPTAPGPELRALPDELTPASPEALQRFAEDLQSPEYIQALLMALSGAAAPPGGAKASSGVLQTAKDWLNSIPDDALGRIESGSLAQTPGYADEIQAMLGQWAQPASKLPVEVARRSAIEQSALESPIQGVLNALKFSLGRDLPKTAAMAAR